MRLPVFLAALTLASCSTTPPARQDPVTPGQLAAIARRPQPAKDVVTVGTRVLLPSGQAASIPNRVTTRFGQEATVEAIRELVYPTDFSFPGTGKSSFAVTPNTPASFATANTGWTLKFTPEKRPGTVVLKGSVSYVVHDGFADAPGENLSPIINADGIVVSENRARLPMLSTYTTPVFIAASTVGKPYRLPLSHPQKGTYLEITVELIATP